MHHRLARVQGVQDKEIASEQRQIDQARDERRAGPLQAAHLGRSHLPRPGLICTLQ
jgi:hypothetical protein